MKVIKWLILGILLPFMIIGGFLGYSIMTDYRPEMVEDSVDLVRNGKPLRADKSLSFTTFNIGYAGLDAGQDFFMEDGKMSRSSSAAQTRLNMEGIITFLKAKSSDFYLLQEVDTDALRSFNVNEVDMISSELPGYNGSFVYNYKVKWVPVPVIQPMGGVESGLMTMSRSDFDTSKRYRLPGDEPIPKRYYDLKRCVMENIYTLDNGKKLIVMNVHLSAYDEGGKVRALQIDWLINHIAKVYDPKDNYLLIGGDWNHLMSQSLRDKIEGEVPDWVATLPEKLTSATGFKVVYDESIGTSRSNEKPYVKGENFEAVIDGFLVSPNIEVLGIKATDLGFIHSDHNPVTIEIGFK